MKPLFGLSSFGLHTLAVIPQITFVAPSLTSEEPLTVFMQFTFILHDLISLSFRLSGRQFCFINFM